MWIAIGLVLLLVAGCGYATKAGPIESEPEPDPFEPDPPAAERKRYGVSLAVDPTDSKLVPVVLEVAKAWNRALNGEWVTVRQDGDVSVIWVETVQGEGCPTDIPEGFQLSGCAVATASPDAHIQLAESMLPEKLYGILLHETGHILRAASGHIDHPGSEFPPNPNNVMNTTGDATTMKDPTADDAAFVWQGMRYDYSQAAKG